MDVTEIRDLDYQTLYRWRLLFLSFPAVGAAGLPLAEDLDIRCETTQLPSAENQKIEIALKNHTIYQHGKLTYNNSLDMTWLETTDNRVKSFLKVLRELTHQTRTGASVTKQDLESTVQIQLLNQEDDPVWQYTMFGMFFMTADPGQLGNESDIQRVTGTLSYDFFDDGPV